MRIPVKNRDLRRYVIWKHLKKWSLLLAWMLVWYAGAIFYNQEHQTYPDERRMTGWRMGLLMLAAFLVGMFLFRIWRLLTTRAISGTILQAGLSRSCDVDETPQGRLRHAREDTLIRSTLLIRTDRGRKRRIRFEQKNGFYLYYHEGERIARLGGLPYPINLDPDAPNGYVCAACGRHSAEWTDHCAECGFSMIAPKDLTVQ